MLLLFYCYASYHLLFYCCVSYHLCYCELCSQTPRRTRSPKWPHNNDYCPLSILKWASMEAGKGVIPPSSYSTTPVLPTMKYPHNGRHIYWEQLIFRARGVSNICMERFVSFSIFSFVGIPCGIISKTAPSLPNLGP